MINGQLDNYTISVYTLIESGFDFGLKDYPIFNEEYRPILNKAILDTYMMHEIGWTNTAVFKHFLNTRMSTIMRNKYNALYAAKAKDFNPLYTLDVYEEYTHKLENTNTGEVNTNSNTTNNSTNNNNNKVNTTNTNDSTVNTDVTSETSNDALALASNYPSENMTNNDLTANIYVNNGQKNTNKNNSTDTTEEKTTGSGSSEETTIGSGTTTATINGIDKTTNSGNNSTNENYSKHSYGSASDLSFAHAMVQFKDYCDKFDLDNQVIAELSDLFINIY